MTTFDVFERAFAIIGFIITLVVVGFCIYYIVYFAIDFIKIHRKPKPDPYEDFEIWFDKELAKESYMSGEDKF